MKLAVISDLHIGDKTSTDVFGHSENEFIEFLRHLENNFDKIVLLGDIFECLSLVQPFKTENQLLKSINSYPKLSNKFLNDKRYIYIPGNHDSIASMKFNLDDNAVVNEPGGVKILFKHGHQFDPFVSKAPKFYKFCTWVTGWMLRLGLKRVYEFIIKVEHRLNDSGDNITPYHKQAIKSAKKIKAKVVVTGHTHMLRRFEYDEITYANCGTCSGGQFNFLCVDTINGHCTLNAWY
jgi:UDP-2,3-diacylglucosamine pyrophosphatase LpxH